ncbi:HupE/UreJ family protein [Opitutaceae bacterium TAV4]|nr:HupE/UreJ family protein [Opitutaceae bacterium TAV4]RRJ99172.1 HupE/UreJ family protein [Opitutaceae bacterium TAV3]
MQKNDVVSPVASAPIASPNSPPVSPASVSVSALAPGFAPVLVALALCLFFLPSLALAHPGHEGGHELAWDFGGGFSHPFTGWDHLLAMTAVGLWAAMLGGRARWLVPSAFVGLMVIGAGMAIGGWVIPGMEQGIAASLCVLGLLIAFAVRLPVVAGMGVAGFFAVFHGMAHGAEMPVTAGAFSYALGFASATVILHGLGLAFGVGFARQGQTTGKVRVAIARVAGGLVAAGGVLAFAL